MDHFLAIDGICAWPNLSLLPDGTLLAVVFNQPCHGLWEGDVESWASTDGGTTWIRRGIVAPHEPGTNRMNVAVGLARNGDVIALVSGWDKRQRSGHPSGFSGCRALPVWVCRSKDGGATWTHTEAGLPTPEGMRNGIPYGDIIPLGDQTLGACVYASNKERKDSDSYFYSSADDGQTWQLRSTIHAGEANETAPAALPDGTLLAAARTRTEQHLELFRSSDHGVSWEPGGPLSAPWQIPAHLLCLGQDQVLLTHGIRVKDWGFLGIAARLSRDAGASWSSPVAMVRNTHDESNRWLAKDGGYPSTVRLEDGTLVTAYYTSGNPRHHRYHMAVVRWRIEDVSFETGGKSYALWSLDRP